MRGYFSLTNRHHRLRASDRRLKSKRRRGVRAHGVVKWFVDRHHRLYQWPVELLRRLQP
jgi:hypothetical protein